MTWVKTGVEIKIPGIMKVFMMLILAVALFGRLAQAEGGVGNEVRFPGQES
jgi:hypothetical protein